MAPSVLPPEPPGDLGRPVLLNEKFKVHSYDGGAFKSRAQYDIKHTLIPIIEPFHCSGNGTKFNLVLKATEDFTLSHFYVSGPGPRCTEPVRSGLVWVTNEPPDVDLLKKYDTMSPEDLMEIMKGLRCTSPEASKSLPDPCVYFKTDPTTRETEVELSKWREGRYVTVKFLDTHKDQVNIDVGILAFVGYPGAQSKRQRPFGPWMKRSVQQIWVHPKPLKSMFSSSGWVCDGRDFTGGCRSGQTDFHQTSVYTVTFRCTTSAIDLCENCAYDPMLGRVTEASVEADLEALADSAMCKLAVSRIRNQWRRNWPESLPKYFAGGLLDVLVQALQKSTESTPRQEDDRLVVQSRQQTGAEVIKRQVRRALLQLTAELTQRMLGIGPGGDVNPNDLVWALCPEPEEHWDAGRVMQLPRGDRAVSPEAANGFLVSWRDGPSPSRVAPKNVWKMTADDDVMVATTNLFSEVSNGEACDHSKVNSCLQQGADLVATNGEGSSSLLAAVRAGVSAEVVGTLLENGAYPDVAGREGVTPLQYLTNLQREQASDAAGANPAETSRISQCIENLRKHGAELQDEPVPGDRLTRLRETFGMKMVTSLLTLQSPISLPVEVLDVLYLLLKELPLETLIQALEPQAFRALSALLQHFVGGTDNISIAMVGCRIMRALYSRSDPTLRHLVLSHGAERWVRKLASLKDAAQCGLYRLPHHDKVTPDDLNKEANALLQEVSQSSSGPDQADRMQEVEEQADAGVRDDQWRQNARLVQVVDAMKATEGVSSLPPTETDCDDVQGSFPKATCPRDGLFAFRELLKMTEKGGLSEERITAYEMEQSNLPGELLDYLQHVGDTGNSNTSNQLNCPRVDVKRWNNFREAFSERTKQSRKGMGRLMKALHAVVETGEVFPVWRHKKERGLRVLSEPIALKLRNVCEKGGDLEQPAAFLPEAVRNQISVSVEPLVQVGLLSRYLLRVTPVADVRYLTFCRRIVGAQVRKRNSEERATIVKFEVLSASIPLPVHSIEYEGSGKTQTVLLALCDFVLVTPPGPGGADLDFLVALDRLCVVGGFEAFPGLLNELQRRLQGEPVGNSMEMASATETVLQEVVKLADGMDVENAKAIVVEELGRVNPLGGASSVEAEGTSNESGVDPSLRAHTVMIAVSDEIPFELFWPMVRDDIIGAVRELFPRASSTAQMEEAVQAGVTQNGMGPIAQKLTLDEAETLAARVGHVVQTAVSVDAQVAQELQRDKSKNVSADPIPLAARVQFSARTGDAGWQPGVVVGSPAAGGSGGEKFDVIDDAGTIWQQLPRSKVRVPAPRRETPSSAGQGMPIQAVLSQADLFRIREHLRRRQEEWAERHAQGGGQQVAGVQVGTSGGGFGAGSIGSGPGGSSSAGGETRLSRPRAGSAGVLDAPRRRVTGGDLLSRDGSLTEVVDAGGALDMMHFMNEDGMADDDYDDEGEGLHPGDDGEDDDEDLPFVEPSEAGDSQGDMLPPPQLGGRGGGDGDAGISMEDDLRAIEQLRAMEQIISEVLDPQDGMGRRRGDPGGDDATVGAPMANVRIRMGGSTEGRFETYAFRRASGSRGGERGTAGHVDPLRGDLAAFVRASDSSNLTSTLDHPVAARLGAADLMGYEQDSEGTPSNDLAKFAANLKPPRLFFRFCLQPPAEPQPEQQAAASPEPAEADSTNAQETPNSPEEQQAPSRPVTHASTEAAALPVPLPTSWSMLRAMQFLQDQRDLRHNNPQNSTADTAALQAGAPLRVVRALQKVSLDSWCLGYIMDIESHEESAQVGMDVDGPCVHIGASSEEQLKEILGGLPAKKRRRTGHSTNDAVAREVYTCFSKQVASGDGAPSVPHQLIAQCGENPAVASAVELMHLLKAHGLDLGLEPGLWVSSKLDRKLRYQLEDPLSVVSGTLPWWATTLPRLCPFLFSLKTRKMLLKYTAFGASFAVHWTQENKVGAFLRRRATVQTELNAQTDPRKMQELSQELSNIEEHIVKSSFWFGTLQSTLVRMQKGEELLRQSEAAMEIVAFASNLVEVQFDDETGFGSAVTQSFYVEIAKMLQERERNRDTPMWVTDSDPGDSQYLLSRRGLMMRPLVEGPERDKVARRFQFLGRCMGQALREGFIVPLPLSEEVFSLVLGEPLGCGNLPRPGSGCTGELVGALADFSNELVEGETARVAAAVAEGRAPPTPEEQLAWRREQAAKDDFGERFLAPRDDAEHTAQEVTSFERYISLVEPCFVETGLSGAPVCPGGENKAVDVENVHEFVEQVSQFWFDGGTSAQVDAFRAGMNDVFPIGCLAIFTPSELREMFCGEDRIEWDEQQLLAHFHPGGGLTSQSPSYRFLLAVLLEMNQAERSRFLDFVSSCPRLPPGGITKFHVDVFPDATSEQAFPRSRACANQLYLPPYSSKEDLQAKLHEATHSSAGHHEQRMREL